MTTIDVTLAVAAPNGTDEARSLLRWLARDPTFREVRLASGNPKHDQLGAAADVIALLLGTAGGGAALAGALTVWMNSRTTEVRVSATVFTPDGERTIEITKHRAHGLDELLATLDRALDRDS